MQYQYTAGQKCVQFRYGIRAIRLMNVTGITFLMWALSLRELGCEGRVIAMHKMQPRPCRTAAHELSFCLEPEAAPIIRGMCQSSRHDISPQPSAFCAKTRRLSVRQKPTIRTLKPLIIIKAGSSLPQLLAERGDFDHWIREGIADDDMPIQVVDPRRGDALPAPEDIAGVIVTGSHAMVTERRPWSESVAQWLAELVAHDTPVLGICYGHQLLAHAMGGEVDFHPGGTEIGTVPVSQTPHGASDILFQGLPTQFMAHVVHRQSVRRLSEGAVHLAENGFEKNHAFRIGKSAWGIQFHPEFDSEVMRRYLQFLAADLQNENRDVAALLNDVAPAHEAGSVLKKFGSIVRTRQSQ